MLLELSIIGVSLSCLFILLFKYYPGGIIVPVYFAMYMYQPKRIIGTLIIAFIIVLIYKLLSKKLLIFGRRRFVFLLVLSVFLTLIINSFTNTYALETIGYRTLGAIIPGLLGNNIARQGIVITLISLFIVSVLTFFSFRLVFIL
ncbi:MAG: poly-gamma-glutamate biosynthesis protein PgsC [Kosmotogaceae bacterium]